MPLQLFTRGRRVDTGNCNVDLDSHDDDDEDQ